MKGLGDLAGLCRGSALMLCCGEQVSTGQEARRGFQVEGTASTKDGRKKGRSGMPLAMLGVPKSLELQVRWGRWQEETWAGSAHRACCTPWHREHKTEHELRRMSNLNVEVRIKLGELLRR